MACIVEMEEKKIGEEIENYNIERIKKINNNPKLTIVKRKSIIIIKSTKLTYLKLCRFSEKKKKIYNLSLCHRRRMTFNIS